VFQPSRAAMVLSRRVDGKKSKMLGRRGSRLRCYKSQNTRKFSLAYNTLGDGDIRAGLVCPPVGVCWILRPGFASSPRSQGSLTHP
jgi:hypothetical protein